MPTGAPIEPRTRGVSRFAGEVLGCACSLPQLRGPLLSSAVLFDAASAPCEGSIVSLTSPWSNLPPLGCWQIPRVVLLSGIFLRIQNEKNSSGPMKTGIVIVPSRFCCRAFALGISLPLIESEREGIFPVVHDFSEKRVVFAPVPRSKVHFRPSNA